MFAEYTPSSLSCLGQNRYPAIWAAIEDEVDLEMGVPKSAAK